MRVTIAYDEEEDVDAFYERLSRQIEREDQLVNIRLGWMLATQGLLFTAFALVVGKDIAPETYKLMKRLMPLMGAAIALFTLFGVLGAYMALDELKKKWPDENKHKKFSSGVDDIYKSKLSKRKYIRPFGAEAASTFGALPGVSLPLVFLFVWTYLFFELPKPIIEPKKKANSDSTFNVTGLDSTLIRNNHDTTKHTPR